MRHETPAKDNAKSRPIPLRDEDRLQFLNESETALTNSSLDSVSQRLMRAALDSETGVISKEQYFTLHGLAHRGIKDTEGNKATKRDAAGNLDPRMTDRCDHELHVVEPAQTSFYGENCGGGDFSGSDST